MRGDMNHILGSLIVIEKRQHENIYTVCNTYTHNFLFFVHLLSSVALPVIPNRDSPNGYPKVKRDELQPVTLAH